ncbi:MAG TPA: TonB-dependent receptor [Usitatibacter sp.]|nr:TonB-dependent receptor [Usitatibacter sp.]
MNRKDNKLAIAVAAALAFGTTGFNAFAQQPAASAPQSKERIEVTGSNIKRVEGESSLPVTVISREEIDKSGATNAVELLQLIGANASAGSVLSSSTIGATTFSAQTANLRGLTGGRTLVLINGHRVNGFAGEVNGVQGVNLSVIPFSAIERVEVLKDGASAVYGSDAIAGVINFIMRSDYRGAEATVWFGEPTRTGGGRQEKYTASAGFGDLNVNRFNVFISGSAEHQHPLDQKDRNFSRSAYLPDINYSTLSSNTFPGRVTTGGIGTPGGTGNCTGGFSSFFPDLGNCFFDPASEPGVESIPDTKDTNFFGQVKFQLTNSWQVYGTGLYSKNENHFIIQPVPISNLFNYGPNGDIPATVTVSPGSPFYPTADAIAAGVNGQVLNVRYRAALNGNRDTLDTNEGYQLVGGLKGSWGNWDADVSYTYAQGKVKEVLNGGFPLYSLALPLLNGGTVNLFGPNSQAIADAVKATNFNGETFHGKATSEGFQGKISSELFQMANGPFAVAVGGEYRKEKLNQFYNPVLSTGDVSGYGGTFSDVNASRDDTAFYGEVNIPLLRTLEANLAIRTDNYSDFGRTTNPKASIRFQPNRDVLLRASYGKGFLAPSLFQLFVPQTSSVTPPGVTDPIRCPVTHDTGLDCNTQFGITFGGNPNLAPEKSENATAGIVFEPTNSLSVSADYFKIRLNNVITTGIPFPTILANLDIFGNLVTRGPADPNFPGLPGRIQNINQTNINLGALHIEGWDLEGHYKWPRQGWGRLRFDISGTYYVRNDAQNLDKSYTGFVANDFGAVVPGTLPRWKHYATITWDSGPWSASIAQNYQSSYVDVGALDADGLVTRRVSSMELYDVQGSYNGFRNVTLTVGAKNVFDRDPPLTNQNLTFQAGYDPNYYDARARFIYAAVRVAFK